jgi:hypothetical protein
MLHKYFADHLRARLSFIAGQSFGVFPLSITFIDLSSIHGRRIQWAGSDRFWSAEYFRCGRQFPFESGWIFAKEFRGYVDQTLFREPAKSCDWSGCHGIGQWLFRGVHEYFEFEVRA